MDVVGTHGDDLLAKVERGEGLDHGLAALFALELVRARIFEVRHHVVDRSLHRVGGVLMKLQAVPGIGHLGAGDDETSALVENVHLLSCLWRKLRRLARQAFLRKCDFRLIRTVRSISTTWVPSGFLPTSLNFTRPASGRLESCFSSTVASA